MRPSELQSGVVLLYRHGKLLLRECLPDGNSGKGPTPREVATPADCSGRLPSSSLHQPNLAAAKSERKTS